MISASRSPKHLAQSLALASLLFFGLGCTKPDQDAPPSPPEKPARVDSAEVVFRFKKATMEALGEEDPSKSKEGIVTAFEGLKLPRSEDGGIKDVSSGSISLFILQLYVVASPDGTAEVPVRADCDAVEAFAMFFPEAEKLRKSAVAGKIPMKRLSEIAQDADAAEGEKRRKRKGLKPR